MDTLAARHGSAVSPRTGDTYPPISHQAFLGNPSSVPRVHYHHHHYHQLHSTPTYLGCEGIAAQSHGAGSMASGIQSSLFNPFLEAVGSTNKTSVTSNSGTSIPRLQRTESLHEESTTAPRVEFKRTHTDPASYASQGDSGKPETDVPQVAPSHRHSLIHASSEETKMKPCDSKAPEAGTFLQRTSLRVSDLITTQPSSSCSTLGYQGTYQSSAAEGSKLSADEHGFSGLGAWSLGTAGHITGQGMKEVDIGTSSQVPDSSAVIRSTTAASTYQSTSFESRVAGATLFGASLTSNTPTYENLVSSSNLQHSATSYYHHQSSAGQQAAQGIGVAKGSDFSAPGPSSAAFIAASSAALGHHDPLLGMAGHTSAALACSPASMSAIPGHHNPWAAAAAGHYHHYQQHAHHHHHPGHHHYQHSASAMAAGAHAAGMGGMELPFAAAHSAMSSISGFGAKHSAAAEAAYYFGSAAAAGLAGGHGLEAGRGFHDYSNTTVRTCSQLQRG
jgi:hypothetical protein